KESESIGEPLVLLRGPRIDIAHHPDLATNPCDLADGAAFDLARLGLGERVVLSHPVLIEQSLDVLSEPRLHPRDLRLGRWHLLQGAARLKRHLLDRRRLLEVVVEQLLALVEPMTQLVLASRQVLPRRFKSAVKVMNRGSGFGHSTGE